MKKILLFVCVILSCAHLHAQTIIYRETFDDMPGYWLAGWGNEYSGGVAWQAGLPALVGICMSSGGSGPMAVELGTNKVACIPDCGTFNPNNGNVFTYTPSISLTGMSGTWLRYDSYFGKYTDGADTERATVEVSTDDGATWSVIEDVAASVPIGTFKTHYIDLSAYSYTPSIRIGFRYSDDSGNMSGWAIDNVEVFKPAPKDLSLLSVTPAVQLLSYVNVGNYYMHEMEVYNAGLDTIHSFTLNYQQAGGSVKHDIITGVSLPHFSTTTFTHSIPDSVFSLGDHPVVMWVSLDSDAYHYNDSARTLLKGAEFIPAKRIALESGVGTWNARSPRYMVAMASVHTTDISASLVEVHSGDPMRDTAYDNFLFNLNWNYTPYILLDRRVSIPVDSFLDYLNTQSRYFGFANINLDANFDTGNISINATIKPAIDLNGDYRIALVITEDLINSSAYGYDQHNGYAGGVLGPMGGYDTLPNPVPGALMTYNNVGRKIYPDPQGQDGCLPGSMTAGETYNCSLSTTIDTSWNTAHLHVIVMLINQGDSSILNCVELPVTLMSPAVTATALSAGMYPNPADAATRVFFDLTNATTAHITLSDLTGRTLYEYPQTTFNAGRNEINIPVQQLANGMYLVSISTPEGHRTFKLEVMH